MTYLPPDSSLELVLDTFNSEHLRYPIEISFVQQVRDIIDKHLDDHQFGVSDVAKNVHLSISQLNRRLKTYTGYAAGYWIRKARIEYAAHLLIYQTNSIGEVAYKVGYSHQAHFCRSFKQWFGCSPSRYAKQWYRRNEPMRENGK